MFYKGLYYNDDSVQVHEDGVNVDGQVENAENLNLIGSTLAPIPPHIHGHLHGLEFFI